MYGAVALGGALGSVGRAWLGGVIGGAMGPGFPWGTLAINVLGSFVMGWFAAITEVGARAEAAAQWQVFVMVGLCGGFTTFSAFSLQTLELLRAGAMGWAGAYVAGSVLLCLVGVWTGVVLGR